jgi:hypothetical protein
MPIRFKKLISFKTVPADFMEQDLRAAIEGFLVNMLLEAYGLQTRKETSQQLAKSIRAYVEAKIELALSKLEE